MHVRVPRVCQHTNFYCIRLHLVHDNPLYLVRPDLLCAVSETAYGIRVGFIRSDKFFTTFILDGFGGLEVRILATGTGEVK